MTRTPFLNRCSLAATTALAAVLAFGTVDAVAAGNYGSQGAQQQQSQQLQNGSQSTPKQQHVREAQQELMERGYDVGSVDGQLGPKTSSALREFQQAEGIQPSGQLDRPTLEKLEIAEMDGRSGSTIRGSGSNSGSPDVIPEHGLSERDDAS
jgi:peptidoglycan hydrolase-like protein with peptidoglycan-binding domain